ncbi:MAG TPA: DNA gyrase inhibitor YacG [Tepidisphaeraceae bacterium]|nr:DNA gyrase inhibitor YacG [Tepidisphaeraceae bacterium]
MATPCPICKKPVEPPPDESTRSAFPFCSDRCKLIDLGRWLDGKYQVPVAGDDLDESLDAQAEE